MFAALAASFVFTFTYATLAAKSRRAEMVLIPMLDILQSVPILGFLSFTVTFFLGLFPGNVLGAECAAIFAIFTSQAWNMAFSLYQSLRTVPRDLDEVARGFRLTGWQKFWQLEAPFAMPGLIWNTMMSMSGGWFFVVASEAITVGDTTITLPGVGSYIAAANDAGRWDAIVAAVATMASSFCFTTSCCSARSSPGRTSSASSCRSASRSSAPGCSTCCGAPTGSVLACGRSSPALRSAAFWRLSLPRHPAGRRFAPTPASRASLDVVWIVVVVAVALWALWSVVAYRRRPSSAGPTSATLTLLTFYTLLRVVVLMALATLVLGADQRVDRPAGRAGPRRLQPIAQFLAAFPANLLFRAAVSLVLDLPPQPRHLADAADRLRHAMVHRVQRHRRRRGLPQRPARGGDEFPRPRLGLVAARSSCPASRPTT